MQNESTLERHHKQHRDVVAEIIHILGLPINKILMVGSASIAQQYILTRKPGDLDFYVEDVRVWEYAKTLGREVPGLLGNSVIKISIEGWEVELFRFLPNFPNRRRAGVFKRAVFQNGVLCMNLVDVAIWKFYLRRMKERKEYKKKQDYSDIMRSVRGIFSGYLKPFAELNQIQTGLLNYAGSI